MKVRMACAFTLAIGLILLLGVAVTVQSAKVTDSNQAMTNEALAAPASAFSRLTLDSTSLDYTAQITFTPVSTAYLPLVARDYTPPLYLDDFSDPSSGWSIEDYGHTKFGYQDGEYEISLLLDGQRAGDTSPFGSFSNYAIEADMRRHAGSYGVYGLIFDQVDWEHFYVFCVAPDFQVYHLFRCDVSGWTTILGSVYSSHINLSDAVNRLRVERQGSQAALYVNGHYLTTVDDDTYTGTLAVGLYAQSTSSFATMRFDNFKIWQ